ncbi:MAG: exonuclease domain-containing protein [Ruminococcus sp.]|nr:exonuclease domain-containing protein [Ruminococcus sp.]
MSKYVIVDLEMCRVNKENFKAFGAKTELIQIGAVLVDDNLEIADTFMTYVKPQYGAIDDFIEKLTGISPANVANAPESKEAIQLFTDWIPDDAQIVSWSESDADQIISELDGKYIDNPKMEDLLDTWIDCQITFSEKMNNTRRSYKLSEALIIADIFYDEGEHDALVDAKNTAQLFIKMEKEEEFQINSYLKQGEQNNSFNFGNIKMKK